MRGRAGHKWVGGTARAGAAAAARCKAAVAAPGMRARHIPLDFWDLLSSLTWREASGGAGQGKAGQEERKRGGEGAGGKEAHGCLKQCRGSTPKLNLRRGGNRVIAGGEGAGQRRHRARPPCVVGGAEAAVQACTPALR